MHEWDRHSIYGYFQFRSTGSNHGRVEVTRTGRRGRASARRCVLAADTAGLCANLFYSYGIVGGHGGAHHEFPPKPAAIHVWGGKFFGAVMWFWIFYRAKQDLPALLGWEHPWEHGHHGHDDDHDDHAAAPQHAHH